MRLLMTAAQLSIAGLAFADSTGNLLVNPGAESGPSTGWTIDNGQLNRFSTATDPGYTPHSGTYWFYGGTAANSTVYQDISLVAGGRTANSIDNGFASIDVSWWNRTYNQNLGAGNNDRSQVLVYFLNGAGSVISTAYASGMQQQLNWTNYGQSGIAVPAGARFVRYRMDFARVGGTDNDGYIDDNFLSLYYTRDVYWKAGVSGTWSDNARWTAVTPAASEDVHFSQSGNYAVSLTSSASVNSLSFGANSGSIGFVLGGNALQVAGDVWLDSGTLVAPAVYGGTSPAGAIGMNGYLHISHGAELKTIGLVFNGAGNDVYFNGGTISVTGGPVVLPTRTVGVYYDANATLYPNSIEISDFHTPSFNLLGGATFSTSASDVFIGHSGVSGRVKVSGTGSALTLNSGSLRAGTAAYTFTQLPGTGTLDVIAGGNATVVGTGYFGSDGGAGTLSVSGQNSTASFYGGLKLGQGQFSANVRGTGIVSITNGGAVFSFDTLTVGSDGGVGSLSIDGQQSIAGAVQISVGEGGAGSTPATFVPSSGSIRLTNGAAISTSTGATLGMFGGIWSVTFDSGSTGDLGGELTVGYAMTSLGKEARGGAGTLVIANGSSVTSTGTITLGAVGATGSASVSGPNTFLESADHGLIVADGAAFTANGTQESVGLLNADDHARVSVAYSVIGGDGGNGEVNITDGASLETSLFVLVGARTAGGALSSNGRLTVSNEGSLHVGDELVVGLDGGSGEVFLGAYDSYSSTLASVSGTTRVGTGAVNTFGQALPGSGTLTVYNSDANLGTLHVGTEGGRGLTSVRGQLSATSLLVGSGTFSDGSVSLASEGTLSATYASYLASSSAEIGTRGGAGTVDLRYTTWNNAGAMHVGGNLLGQVGAGTVILEGPFTHLNAGSLTVWSGGVIDYQSGSLNAGSLAVRGGRIRVGEFPYFDYNVLQCSSLVITNGGTIDLRQSAIVLDYPAASPSPLSTVQGYVAQARNGGNWNGPAGGITSSLAAENAQRTTGLGVVSGADLIANYGPSYTVGNVPVDASSVVVKYTWNGDANLDGRITFDDYVKIDTGFNAHRTGWINGDFNYSGGVSFDDYVLIDIAFNQQNGTLDRTIDWLSGDDRSSSAIDSSVETVIDHFGQFGVAYGAAFLAAVPESGAASACVFMAAAALHRRRRAHVAATQ